MSSSLSIACVAEKCELASLALCQCCKKNLCIDHLNEHANQRNEKLLPFVDKINVLLNRFSSIYNGEQPGLKQLDQWREDAYKLIENFYEKKRRELLDETTDQQQEQLNQMQTRLKELIRTKGGTQQDFDVFSDNLCSIEQYLDTLQQTQVTLPTLKLDDDSIVQPSIKPNDSIEKIKSPEREDNSVEISSNKKKSSSKKKKKSSRYSDDSSDRSSHHRSRSPRNSTKHSKRKHEKSTDSNSSSSSSHKKGNCDDCRDCRFYQDRFGPGFMDSFGPCSCDCHKWAYSQNSK